MLQYTSLQYCIVHYCVCVCVFLPPGRVRPALQLCSVLQRQQGVEVLQPHSQQLSQLGVSAQQLP